MPASIIDFCQLPLKFLEYECNWETNDVESNFLQTLKILNDESIQLEVEKQRDYELWFKKRENRITSSNTHKIFIHKRNFETLVQQITNKKFKLFKGNA